MDGFLNVNKPAGLTSHDVVYRVRRWSGEPQVGHAGTLDPDATGVLPLGLGHATRLLEFWPEPKVYLARIEFGVETDTYDAAGEVVARMDASAVTLDRIRAALPEFEGEIAQRPPRFSALKHQGERMYPLARRGVVVEPPPRPVRIYSLAAEAWDASVLTLRVTCGRGAYARALAHDLGAALGSCAHLQRLEREQDGGFLVAAGLTLEQLQHDFQAGDGEQWLHPLDFPLQHWPWIQLNADQERELLMGRNVVAGELSIRPGAGAAASPPTVGAQGRLRAHGSGGRLLGLLEPQPMRHVWHPFKVFPPQ